MNNNREIRDGIECIVEYDTIEKPVTHETENMPICITDVETGEVTDITYSDDAGKLKKTMTKREKRTLDDIWKKLFDIEDKIGLLLQK